MGRSITCNFQVHIYGSEKRGAAQYGAMSLKDIKGLVLLENDYLQKSGEKVTRAIIWSQTKAGEKYLKGYDFMIMTPDNKITYHLITENV